MPIITKNNFTYNFIDCNKILPYDEIIQWLEYNNPIYFRLHESLLSSDYTGIIKIYIGNKLFLHIKICEGFYIQMQDFISNIIYYMENSKIPLEIREYNDFNKCDVRYIYDKYIIKNNTNNTLDIVYRDTMDEDLDFDLRNILIEQMTTHEKNIYNKFNQIIKETKLKICNHVDNI